MELDNLAFARVLALELRQRGIEVWDPAQISRPEPRRPDEVLVGQLDPLPSLDPGHAEPRVVDKHAAHCSSRGRDEVLLVGELPGVLSDQAQPGFVQERCRLQGVAGPLPSQQLPCDPLEVGVNDREEAFLRHQVSASR